MMWLIRVVKPLLIGSCVLWLLTGNQALAATPAQKDQGLSEGPEGGVASESAVKAEEGSTTVDLADPAIKMRMRYDIEAYDGDTTVVLAAGSKVLVRACDEAFCEVWPYKGDPHQSAWSRFTEGRRIIAEPNPRKVPLAAVRGKRFHTYSHQPVSEPVFPADNDSALPAFEQGPVGDCVLMAALAALSITDFNAVHQMFTDEGDSCRVRLYRPAKGNDDSELVPTDLRTSKRLIAKRWDVDPHATGALYAALLEKAFVDIIPLYTGKADVPSYELLDGVSFRIALSALTGRQARGVSLMQANTVEERRQTLSLMRRRLDEGEVMIAATKSTSTLLPEDHAYAVLAVEDANPDAYVTVYNPHGDVHPLLASLPAFVSGKRGVAYRKSLWSNTKRPYATTKATSRLKAEDFFESFDLVFWTKR